MIKPFAQIVAPYRTAKAEKKYHNGRPGYRVTVIYDFSEITGPHGATVIRWTSVALGRLGRLDEAAVAELAVASADAWFLRQMDNPDPADDRRHAISLAAEALGRVEGVFA